MKEDVVQKFLSEGRLRSREVDKNKIASLLDSSKINAEVALSIPKNDKNATVIFREIYESVRQLGEAKWLLFGFDPLDHDVSLESLKEIDIKNKVKLNFLERFRKIRNDANYRGFRVSLFQAEEIAEFWHMCGLEILNSLYKEACN